MQPSILERLSQQNDNIASNLSSTLPMPSVQDPTMAGPVVQSSMPAAQTDTSSAPQQQVGDNGNWLTNLLPTVGSIGGGILGGIIPGLGPVGAIGGATAGSALGKGLENMIEGNDVTKDVGASALEGGVGQIAGGAIGKVGGALLGKAAPAASKAGEGMIQKQFGDQIDKATASHLAQHGVTDRAAAVNIANRVTGSEGHLPQAINKAFQGSDRVVNVSDLDPTLIKASDNTGVFNMDRAGLTPKMQTTALSNTDAILKSHAGPGDLSKIPTKGGGTTPIYSNGSLQNALPEDVFSMAKKFEKLGYAADKKAYDKAGNTLSSEQADLGGYYKNIANNLNERAFGVGQDAIPLTPEIKNEVLGSLSDIAKSNPQAYKTISEQITNAQNLQDLRSIQAPWVKVSQGDRVATAIHNGQGGVSAGEMLANAAPIVGGATGGVKGLATGAALKAINSPAGNAAGAKTLGKVSDILANPNMQKIVTNAATVPAQTLTHAATDFTGPAGAGQAITMPEGGDVLSNPNLYQEVMGSNSLNALPVQAALNFNMHRQVGDNQNYLADPAVQQALGGLQGTVGAQAQLPALLEAFNAAGGAQGAIGGGLAGLGGMITGGPAAQYAQRADALQKAIQTSTGQNVQLPSLSMNPQAAQSVIQQLLAVLQSSGTPSVTSQLAR